jgi:choline dehydrogenase-like flavoprotein
MGNDAAQSVTNSYGQCHNIPNVFVAGAGLLPTGGAVNHTFSLLALAMRSSNYIKKGWSDYAN